MKQVKPKHIWIIFHEVQGSLLAILSFLAR